MKWRDHILVFWMLSFKPTFSLSSFTFIKRLFSSSLSAVRVVSSAYLRLLIFLPAILKRSDFSQQSEKVQWMHECKSEAGGEAWSQAWWRRLKPWSLLSPSRGHPLMTFRTMPISQATNWDQKGPSCSHPSLLLGPLTSFPGSFFFFLMMKSESG